MKFQKGQSGNPKGRTPGKTTAVKLRKSLDQHVPEILKKLVEQAKAGDLQACKLILERTIPALKAKDLPVVLTGLDGSLTEQGQTIIGGMGKGTLTPSETLMLLTALSSQAKIVEIHDLTNGIEALENEH